MKLLVFCLFCIVVEVFSEQPSDYFQKMASVKVECLSDSNPSPELVEKLMQRGEFADNKDLKCFLKCMLIKTNAMNANGELQVDMWKTQFPPSIDAGKRNAAVEKCKGLKAADACDTAFNVLKCAYESVKG